MSGYARTKAGLFVPEKRLLALPQPGYVEPYSLIDAPNGFLNSFNNLAFDPYAGDAQRYRRFSQYLAFYNAGKELTLWCLPHRDFVQNSAYSAVSGIRRAFAPIEAQDCIQPYIAQLFDKIKLDRNQKYQLDVHQYRVYGTPDSAGKPVPEGVHQDGQQIVAILVLKRHAITPESAKLSLIDIESKQPFFSTVVQQGYGIILNDWEMAHDAGPVVAAGEETGYRDYVVVNVNEWKERRYGPEHEARAAGATTNAIEAMGSLLRRQHKIDQLFVKTHRLIHEDNIRMGLDSIHQLKFRARQIGFEGLCFTETDLTGMAATAQTRRRNNVARLYGETQREDWQPYTDADAPIEDDVGDALTFWNMSRRAQMDSHVLGIQECGNRSSCVLITDDTGKNAYASIIEDPIDTVLKTLTKMGLELEDASASTPGRRTIMNKSILTATL